MTDGITKQCVFVEHLAVVRLRRMRVKTLIITCWAFGSAHSSGGVGIVSDGDAKRNEHICYFNPASSCGHCDSRWGGHKHMRPYTRPGSRSYDDDAVPFIYDIQDASYTAHFSLSWQISQQQQQQQHAICYVMCDRFAEINACHYSPEIYMRVCAFPMHAVLKLCIKMCDNLDYSRKQAMFNEANNFMLIDVRTLIAIIFCLSQVLTLLRRYIP